MYRLAAVFVLLTGCAGQVQGTVIDAEAQCMQHPPLGDVVGSIDCQSAVDGPAGSTCCSFRSSDGNLAAAYCDNGMMVCVTGDRMICCGPDDPGCCP